MMKSQHAAVNWSTQARIHTYTHTRVRARCKSIIVMWVSWPQFHGCIVKSPAADIRRLPIPSASLSRMKMARWRRWHQQRMTHWAVSTRLMCKNTRTHTDKREPTPIFPVYFLIVNILIDFSTPVVAASLCLLLLYKFCAEWSSCYQAEGTLQDNNNNNNTKKCPYIIPSEEACKTLTIIISS